MNEILENLDKIEERVLNGYYTDGHQDYIKVDFQELKDELKTLSCMIKKTVNKGGTNVGCD